MHDGHAAIRGATLTFAHHALHVRALQHGPFTTEAVIRLPVLLVESPGNSSLTPLPLLPPSFVTTSACLREPAAGRILVFTRKSSITGESRKRHHTRITRFAGDFRVFLCANRESCRGLRLFKG